jgi:hypothetical protein
MRPASAPLSEDIYAPFNARLGKRIVQDGSGPDGRRIVARPSQKTNMARCGARAPRPASSSGVDTTG